MLDSELPLPADFPAADRRQWLNLVEQGLNGRSFDETLVTHTAEGIELQPLYTREDLPDTRLSRLAKSRPTSWELRQEISTQSPSEANAAMLAELAGGAASVQLKLDQAAQAGVDPDDPRADNRAEQRGLMAFHVDDWQAALAEVPLEEVAVGFDMGAAFLPAAVQWFALCRRRKLNFENVLGALNADPLAELARAGRLPYRVATGLKQLSDLARWTEEHAPRVTSVGVSSAPYHDTGATATQCLAFALATGVEYLRAMTEAGLQVREAARQVLFRLDLDARHFRALATLRAARLLWARVVESCGESPDASPMQIHAVLGDRELTRDDIHWNWFRNTSAVFAAVLGGADVITSVPFDRASGQSSELGCRLARNTVHVMRAESDLRQLADPAAGSYFLENYTQQLAEHAWKIFQDIESQGDMADALQSGWIGKQLIGKAENAVQNDSPTKQEELQQQVSFQRFSGKVALEDLAQESEPLEAAIDAASHGASVGQLSAALGFHSEATELSTPIRSCDA